MKNKRFVGIIIALLVLSFVLVGCNDPKSLARQYYKLEQQWDNAPSNSREEARIEAEMEKIEEKVEKMSERKQAIFEREYDRLDR